MASGLFAQEAAPVADDGAHGLAHLYETLHGDGFPAEAYVQGKVALQFDLWLRSSDLDGSLKHRVAILQRIPGADLHPLKGRPDIRHFEVGELEGVRSLRDCGERGQQRSVFVFVGQSPERVEAVSAWAVRSVVWLAEFDDVDNGRVEAGDMPVPLFALSVAALLRRHLIEEWKSIPSRRSLAIGSHKDPDEMIERCAEILDVVADDGAPLKWRLASHADVTEIARGLHVYLGDESIGTGFSLQEGVYEGLERLEMQIRSLNLGNTPR